MSNEELLLVRGGGITSTFLNSVARLASTVYNLGRSFGSTFRRLVTRRICQVN